MIKCFNSNSCSFEDTKKCFSPVDIVFIIDTSSSIGLHFETQIKFVKAVFGMFKHGPSRIAIITYGNGAHIFRRLKAFKQKEFLQELDSLLYDPHQPRETSIRDAVALGEEVLSTGEEYSSRVKVLITFVDQLLRVNDGWRMRVTERGIKVFSVNLRSKESTSDKPETDTSTTHTAEVASPVDLPLVLPQFLNLLCDRAAPKECFLPVNLAFLIDTHFFNENHQQLMFETLKSFIKEVAKGLGLSKTFSRLMVIYFNQEDTFLAIRYKGIRDDNHLNEVIDRMGYPPKTQGSTIASLPIKEKGVQIIVVAIGRSPSDRELLPLATTKENLYRVATFEQLSKTVQPLSIHICKQIDPKLCDIPTDVVFTVDASDAISLDELDQVKLFLKRSALSIGIG
ncbi:predicted protein, partial [Nematostella vectensis]